MERSKIFPSEESLIEWMASTGFLFPRSAVELDRFDKLHGKELQEDESDSTVSCDRVLFENARYFPEEENAIGREDLTAMSQYRMAARKGGGLPEHILNKMLNNQKSGESPQEEKD